MKQSKYSINIENPCNQDYSPMKDNYAGKFCSVCEKSVIDFSESSDIEIDTILKRYNYQICAKFRKNQLNKPLNLPKPKTYFSSFLKIVSGLMLLGATEKVVANTDKPNTFKSVFNEDFKNRINENRLIVKNDSLKIIKGNVVSGTDGLSLIAVSVSVEGTSFETLTDFDGNFVVEVPQYLHNKDILILVFSYNVGNYTTQRVKINSNDEIPTNFKITLNEPKIIIGTTAYIKHKRKWWQFWKKKYK